MHCFLPSASSHIPSFRWRFPDTGQPVLPVVLFQHQGGLVTARIASGLGHRCDIRRVVVLLLAPNQKHRRRFTLDHVDMELVVAHLAAVCRGPLSGHAGVGDKGIAARRLEIYYYTREVEIDQIYLVIFDCRLSVYCPIQRRNRSLNRQSKIDNYQIDPISTDPLRPESPIDPHLPAARHPGTLARRARFARYRRRRLQRMRDRTATRRASAFG